MAGKTISETNRRTTLRANEGPTRRHKEQVARKDRIIDVAIRLAEEGGFDNVRQRDVAAQAGVALGTLYKSFRGKEDILSAALERETTTLEKRLERRPAGGESASARLAALFQILTRTMCKKPNYARAVLKAMASGEPETAANVTAHQSHVTNMVVAAMRGPSGIDLKTQPATQVETDVCFLLTQIWFASLVGWSAKLHGQGKVIEQMAVASEWLLRGAGIED